MPENLVTKHWEYIEQKCTQTYKYYEDSSQPGNCFLLTSLTKPCTFTQFKKEGIYIAISLDF